MSDNIERIALASAGTTNPGQTPKYGLTYDLANGQWVSSQQFQQFVRAQLPATQTVAQQQASQLQQQSLHAQELQKAQNYEAHGLFMTNDSLGIGKTGVGNQIETGFAAAKGLAGNVVSSVFGGVGDLLSGHNPAGNTPSYEDYTAKGGLLSEAEFNSFSDKTKLALYDKAQLHKGITDFEQLPGVSEVVQGLGLAYRGLTAAGQMASVRDIPVLGSWLQITGNNKIEKGGNPLSAHDWQQAWAEAQGQSLGNTLLNTVLDPYASQETLDRWKRDNPWYQMTSTGSEILATWYADPVALTGKGVGAAARFARREAPLNENSAYARGLAQTLQREQVTVRNPITKAVVNAQSKRMTAGWKDLKDYALVTSAPEFARTLPMFSTRYRAVDGGAGAFALHWAYNNREAANQILNSEKVRGALSDVASAKDFTLPSTLDVADLTQQLMLGDPKAYAMLSKLQEVAPDELAKIAPGSGTLLDATNALKTRADVLQSEVDDLIAAADKVGPTNAPASSYLEWEHRWEVHTSLADRQAQLADVTDKLHRYDGYSDWLDLLTAKGNPRLSRIAAPTRSRWSEVRTKDTPEAETRALFMDNQYGHAHSFFRMPKGLFLKRANAAELDMAAGVDSGITSIQRQFDQLDNYFGYAPEGARDAAISAYVSAKTSYDRYKIMHSLEEEHVVGAIAAKFGIGNDTASALLNKIYDERNRTINGILTGEGQVYRSAPTIASRLSGKDQTLELVSRDPDTGMVTVNLVKGRHKETYEVPEAALQPRVAPEDITQTPNYYNPLDTRRMFYKIKHDHRLLQEIDAGMATKSKAALADLGTLVGTRFNEFWKPVQLFRLGWPIRVLMDEGARATAIYGPMYWLTGPGAESVYQSGRNLLPNVAEYIMRKRKGPLGVDMVGPGPVRSAAMRSSDQFARDAEVQQAVHLPQSMWDKINPDRFEKIRGHVSAYEDWKRANVRYEAWQRADRQGQESALLDRLLSNEDLSPAQQQLLDYSLDHARTMPGNRPEPPIFDAAKAYYNRLAETNRASGTPAAMRPLVFDHVKGIEHKSGYVVPLSEFAHQLDTQAGSSIGALQGRELMDWYAKHAELLSRQGMRVVVDPRGHLTVGRHFRSNEFKKARQYAEYVSEKDPNVQMWDLAGNKSYHVRAADDLSPIAEATYRYFENGAEKVRQPGKAPVAGQPELFHGTAGDLPESLLPRADAPIASGRMIGDGLYTTASQHLAESYGVNLYTVRGAKSGRTYKVWDLDKPIEDAQQADLIEYLDRHGIILGDQEMVSNMMREAYNPYRLTQNKGRLPNNATWANLYEDLAAERRGDIHDLLHQYLEERHNVGVLTHLGGTTRNAPHQVYVWLHPEDLVVKPLYVPGNEYYSLPQWFDHSQSVENFVPENRIIRKSTERQPVAALPEGSNPRRGDLRAQEVAVQNTAPDLSGFDLEIDSPETWVMRQIQKRHEMGQTWKKVTSSDGRSFYVEGAFAGHKGEMFRGLTASNGALDVLSEGHGHGTSLFRRQSEGYKTYSPPKFTDRALTDPHSLEHKKAVLYFQQYADMVNDHLGNSPIVQRMINGQSNDQIVHWLESTPEGQRIAAAVKPHDMPTGIWVDDHRYKLNYYVPSRKLQRLLGKGRIKPSDFRKNVADEDLPVVYGPDFEALDRSRGAGEFLSDLADKLWTGLGNVPIDTLSRHPFAKAAYDTKIRSLVAQTDSKWLDAKTLARYQDEAHRFALNQTRRHLYNLTETTNFNDALRFVAPFWGAQYEAIQKWLRIISDRPETIGRFFAAQRAVYKNFMVVDQNGNEVTRGTRPGGLHGLGLYHPNDMVVMPLPKWAEKKFGLQGIGSTRIPIGSANTVLQGDLPLFPSLGPLVTIPADQFLRKVSDTYGVEHDQSLLYRWLFPIGRPRSKNAFSQFMDQFSPGWVNRVRQGNGPEDSLSRINMEMLIGREMLYKARKEGKPDPTPAEIEKAANHLSHIREISGIIQPFQVQFMPEHQYFIDAAHRYQKQYGSQWWDKYVQDYGEEAAIFATSSSNSIGVPPTDKGMEEWSKNKTLIAKYPNWTSAIISPQAYMGDFSSDAYGQQFNINLGPGDTRTLRSGTSLQQRLWDDPEVRLGWREYRKLDAAIESELAARGLTSIQQRGAEQLAAIKRWQTGQIMQKYPAWARAYQQQDQTIYSDVQELKTWVGDKAFDNRPDIQGARQYLAIRQKATDALDEYALHGGSRSLQAQENGALRDWFYNQVGQLILDNPAFAEFYSRYLSRDTLTLGGGGF